MKSRYKIILSTLLLVLSAVIIISSILLKERNSPNPVFENITYSEKRMLRLPAETQDLNTNKILLLIVLENLNCATCLNEVVELIDTIKNKFSDQINTIVWINEKNIRRTHIVKKSINREVIYIEKPLYKEYYSFFNSGNRYFFIDYNNDKFTMHLPLPAIPTSKKTKIEVVNYVINNIKL